MAVRNSRSDLTCAEVNFLRTDRGGGLRPPGPPPSFPPSAIRTANFPPEFFRGAVRGGRSRTNHFKKFAKANFLKWCRGGVWGGLPPSGNSVTRALPPGGLGSFAPSGISITHALPPQRPCLAPVPCPLFFFVGFFSSEFARLIFFVGIFWSEFLSSDFFVRRRSVVRSSVVRPSVCRPSVR